MGRRMGRPCRLGRRHDARRRECRFEGRLEREWKETCVLNLALAVISLPPCGDFPMLSFDVEGAHRRQLERMEGDDRAPRDRHRKRGRLEMRLSLP